jgi:hypothetical protein
MSFGGFFALSRCVILRSSGGPGGRGGIGIWVGALGGMTERGGVSGLDGPGGIRGIIRPGDGASNFATDFGAGGTLDGLFFESTTLPLFGGGALGFFRGALLVFAAGLCTGFLLPLGFVSFFAAPFDADLFAGFAAGLEVFVFLAANERISGFVEVTEATEICQ